MISIPVMGNTTKHLSLCVNQSSRKTRRERPYVSRPFWPYEYHHQLNVPSNCPICVSPTIFHENPQSRSIRIVKMTSHS